MLARVHNPTKFIDSPYPPASENQLTTNVKANYRKNCLKHIWVRDVITIMQTDRI